MKIFLDKTQGIVRAILVIIGVLLQIAFMFYLASVLKAHSTMAYILLEMVSIFLVFMLVNDASSYKSFWIVIVLVLPVTGFFLYFMWGRKRINSKSNRHIRLVYQKGRAYKVQKPEYIQELSIKHPNKVQISRFLLNEGFPLYKNTEVFYYDIGEKKFQGLIKDLKTAQKFIFLEYFIINDGQIWQEIKQVLVEKAAQGIEVRLLMDDFGCLSINNNEFCQEMKAAGIKTSVFAPITKDISRLTFNYRNHQKIAVIDGNIGYTGGINIGDEYANIYERFGRWKDSAIRLYGEGVWGLTEIFLEMWEIATGREDMDYWIYHPTVSAEAPGFIQPVSDGPANNPDNPIAELYTHLINKARDYIFITTPYLVLDNRMVEDLCRAARSGVEVKIITPRIYDKWYVYMVTVSNYGRLLENGVHIYEYLPGFIHAKNVVCDDECGICGSINMDYRSFYLHYECGVFMNEVPAVGDMKADIMGVLNDSEEISYESWQKRPWIQKVVQSVLRLFSPLL